jgi:hypothetical protein
VSDIATIAAAMRTECAGEGALRNVNRWASDTLHVHLHRYGRDWGMELSDETPISTADAHRWARAFGAPDGTPVLMAYRDRCSVAQWEDAAYDQAPPVAATYMAGRP